MGFAEELLERAYGVTYTSTDQVLETWGPFMSEDTVLRPSTEFPESSPAQGEAEIRAWWDELFRQFASVRYEVTAWERGDGAILFTGRAWFVGAESGLEADQHFSHLVEVGDDEPGRIARLTVFSYPDRAAEGFRRFGGGERRPASSG